MAEFPFWLDDRQWSAIAAHLPSNQPGPRRVSDRTVISGIVFVLTSKIPWRDCPAQYGPYMTIFNRFNRWKRRSVWPLIVGELAKHGIDLSVDLSSRRHTNVSIRSHQGDSAAKQIANSVTTNTASTSEAADPLPFRLSQGALAELKRLVAERGRQSSDQLLFSLISWHHKAVSADSPRLHNEPHQQRKSSTADFTSETRDLMVFCVSTMIDLNMKLIAALQTADANLRTVSDAAKKSAAVDSRR